MLNKYKKKLSRIRHYIICVFILKSEISNKTKKKFNKFGYNSVINKPFIQLNGLEKISIGDNTVILKGARLSVFNSEKTNENIIDIGKNCYFCYGVSILSDSKSKIIIGNEVLIASNVLITSENHGINPELTVPYMNQELTSGDVYIGDGTWIGERVCILPGVNIGKKCVIGAGSVVTKSVPDFSIAVGNPAKVIKKYDFILHKWVSV